MTIKRRKISAVFRDFIKEIKRLEKYDRENQLKFQTNNLSQLNDISKRQLFMLTESLFFSGFRAYENFLRDIFLLYCMGKKPRNGNNIVSYLNPRDFLHAEELIKSSLPFLDWANPEYIIRRAEIYLKEGYPIKLPITTKKERLNDYKKIRNHIAHNSPESLKQYIQVISKHYQVIPLIIPKPGEFLLLQESHQIQNYKLQVFFKELIQIALDLS